MSDVSRSIPVTIEDPTASSAGSTASPNIILEQAAWPEPPDVISSMGVIAEANGWVLWNAVLDPDDPNRDTAQDHWEWTLEAYFAQCGQNINGGYDTSLYVIKAPDDLEYNLVISHGEISGEVRRDTFLKELSHSVQFEELPDIGYKIYELISYEWEGNCYDVLGSVVPFPTVSLLPDGRLQISESVYGVIRLNFKVFADVYSIVVPVRDEATQEKFASIATAFYNDGDITELTLDPPPLAGVDCLGYTLEVGPGEPSEETIKTAFTAFDYCTGEEITGFTVEVDGNVVDSDGVDLASGTHTLRVTAPLYTPTDEDDLDDNDSFTI